jgi:hypothetical protein
MNSKRRTIELLFSDVSFGTEEFGFLPRTLEDDPGGDGDFEKCEAEDDRYHEHLMSHAVARGLHPRVYDGHVIVDDDV